MSGPQQERQTTAKNNGCCAAVRMEFFNILGGLFKEVDRNEFSNIDGYEDIKEIVRWALNT
jgi:hypothetical protein